MTNDQLNALVYSKAFCKWKEIRSGPSFSFLGRTGHNIGGLRTEDMVYILQKILAWGI